MERFKFITIAFFVLLVSSCKNDKKLIFHEKLNLPVDSYQIKSNYWEVFPVENLDVNNLEKMKEVSDFVLKKYSKNIIETSEYYSISFYEYDEDNISNSVDFNKELIEWKGEFHRLDYVWKKGMFYGITYFDKDGVVVYFDVPVKDFEKHMKVIERTEKTKYGFDSKGNPDGTDMSSER